MSFTGSYRLSDNKIVMQAFCTLLMRNLEAKAKDTEGLAIQQKNTTGRFFLGFFFFFFALNKCQNGSL